MPNKKIEITSFDKMDELMKITDAKGWLGLLGLFFVIVLIIIWLFYGKIITTINGTGMLINLNGIEVITANKNGRIIKFETKMGDQITIDQPIAYIAQPFLEEEINRTQQKINNNNTSNELKIKIKKLNEQFERKSAINSIYNGIVVELEASIGDVVSTGTPLVIIEKTDQSSGYLKGVIYVSAIESKRIYPGMKVAIIPTTIKPEEYGTIVGYVASVSSYPATFKGIMRNLHNEEIVKKILSKENQVEVIVNLILDKNTFSQYKWTSIDGPPIKITSGTLCDAKITVKENKPIDLFIPKIKKVLSID